MFPFERARVYRHQIDATDKEQVQKLAEVLGHAASPFNKYKVCPVCGLLVWVQGSHNQFGEDQRHAAFEFLSDHDEPCEACVEVYRRAPEIARWVANVISFALHESDRDHIGRYHKGSENG